jgi:hypothetical protein
MISIIIHKWSIKQKYSKSPDGREMLSKGVPMDFFGPAAADYRNVESLNRAFLSELRSSTAGPSWRRLLASATREQIKALTDLQLERLAACPFLLLSFREDEPEYWRNLVATGPAGDLLHEAPPPAVGRIVASGLAFLWQLAQRSPYSVRLVSGGGGGFCECLGDVTIVRLLRSAAARNDVVSPRFAEEPAAWTTLLSSGISPTPRVRAAAQLSVLQRMLTIAAPEPRQRLRAAACAAPAPLSRVGDKPVRR